MARVKKTEEPVDLRLFVVIDCKNQAHVYEQIAICQEAGVERVFLINHSVSVQKMMSSIQMAKNLMPWVGANFLGTDVVDGASFAVLAQVDGFWADNIRPWIDCVTAQKRLLNNEVEFFGAAAFKYQPREIVKGHYVEFEEIGSHVSTLIDVLTTTGDMTGNPPTTFKVMDLKRGFGFHRRLAVASGVSSQNIHGLAQAGATDFIVRTSLMAAEKNQLDLGKVERLRKIVDALNSPNHQWMYKVAEA